MEVLTFEQKEGIIMGMIEKMRNRTSGGNRNNNKATWGEEALMLRRQAIMDLMGKGKSRTKIVNELVERWDINQSTAYNYIDDVNKFLSASYKDETEYLKDIIYHKLESLAEDALENRDRKSALKAYEQIAKMGGLFEEKHKVENNMVITFDFGGEGNSL